MAGALGWPGIIDPRRLAGGRGLSAGRRGRVGARKVRGSADADRVVRTMGIVRDVPGVDTELGRFEREDREHKREEEKEEFHLDCSFLSLDLACYSQLGQDAH